MYLEFFQLREYPFTSGCDERFFFQSQIHSEALANMLYTVGQRKGMVLLSGEVGAGKTFLINMLASQLKARSRIGLVSHPPASAMELLRALCESFDLTPTPGADRLALVNQLHRYLEDLHRQGRLIAVVFDEGQDLGPECLEEIRLIWNWEQGGQRLLQIVLVGQPELRQLLSQPRYEALRQRVVLSYHLGRLSRSDTARYIHHRIGVAGGDAARLGFDPVVCGEAFNVTNGVPRLINTLCDNALLTAYARGLEAVNCELLGKVVAEMTMLAPAPGAPPPMAEPEPQAAVPVDPRLLLRGEPVERDSASRPPARGARPAAPPPDSAGHSASPSGASDRPRPRRVAAPVPPVARPAHPAAPARQPTSLLDDLEADPSVDLARKVYQIAQQDSPAHHLSVRVLATRLLDHLPEVTEA